MRSLCAGTAFRVPASSTTPTQVPASTGPLAEAGHGSREGSGGRRTGEEEGRGREAAGGGGAKKREVVAEAAVRVAVVVVVGAVKPFLTVASRRIAMTPSAFGCLQVSSDFAVQRIVRCSGTWSAEFEATFDEQTGMLASMQAGCGWRCCESGCISPEAGRGGFGFR